MAEQAKAEEAKRPTVRKVRLREGVFLGLELHEIDLEGRWPAANKGSVEVYPGKGVLVRYLDKPRGGKPPEMTAAWVPDQMIRQVEVGPEWRPNAPTEAKS